jgi:copper chaperone CopZ
MTTTTKTSARIPWLRYSDDVDRQIAAGLAREAARGERTIDGAPTYRDSARDDRYTVGYGGERHYETKPVTTVKMATEPAKKYLRDLIVKVGRLPGYIELDLDAEVEAMTARECSAAIDRCLAALKAATSAQVEIPAVPARARLNFDEILDGNYALRCEGDMIKFYRITTSKKGFKNVQVRASDELHEVQWKAGIAIMHKIVAAGLVESRMLFVTELGRCCKCGRSLTDEASRANAQVNGGYGPDCVGK